MLRLSGSRERRGVSLSRADDLRRPLWKASWTSRAVSREYVLLSDDQR